MELPRQYYTEEFKQEAVKLIRESGLKLTEAAKRLNIPSQTLKNWLYRDSAKATGQASSSRKPVTGLESENTRLKKELAESRLESDILKKAMVYLCEGVAARYATMKELRLEYISPAKYEKNYYRQKMAA